MFDWDAAGVSLYVLYFFLFWGCWGESDTLVSKLLFLGGGGCHLRFYFLGGCGGGGAK